MYDILSDVFGGSGSTPPPPTSFFLLAEDGGFLLTETGDKIILEGSYMADTKISNLIEATNIGANDLVVLVQGGITKKSLASTVGLVNTNSNLTTTTIGGLSVGSSVLGDTPTAIHNKELFPYQAPAFTAFGISGQANPLEVGDSISGAKTFTWATSNSSNVQANSINIYKVTGGLTALLTGLANDGTEGYTFPSPIQLILPGSYVLRIEGTNTQSALFNRDYTENWYWKLYYGTSANAVLTEAQIKALVGGILTNTVARTYNFAAGGYKYIVVESSLTQPTSFKDSVTGFDIPFNTLSPVSVTNAFSITTTCNVYRSTNQLGSAIGIIVS